MASFGPCIRSVPVVARRPGVSLSSPALLVRSRKAERLNGNNLKQPEHPRPTTLHDAKRKRLAFVGAGRLGSSLAQAAASAGYRVTAISTRRPEQRAWLAAKLPSARIFASPAEAAASADITFITASDRAIEDICQSVTWARGHAVVHCAGALGLDVLRHAEAAGAATGGLHPLQSFPDASSVSRLWGVAFAVESRDPSLREWLRTFARGLGGNPFDILPEHRAAYHASAVLASGMLAGLISLAAQMWGQMGVPRDRANESLLPLVETTVAAVREKGLPTAMTGPYVRGDSETVAKHLTALGALPEDIARSYASLALAQMPVAMEQGGVAETQRAEIEQILRAALAASRPSRSEQERALTKEPSL